MRISELSRLSGVPIATIKYYIREGMLPPGRATAATQAEYDEQHARRLRLIRALIGVRGLSVNATRDVVRAASEHEGDVHEVLGLALGNKLVPGAEKAAPEEADTAEAREADALIAELGWHISERAPAKDTLDETLAALRSVGMDYDWRTLVPYARLAEQTAALDLAQLRDSDDALEQAEQAIILTILLEPALLALRRLAQEHESANRHDVVQRRPATGWPPDGAPPNP